MSFFFFFFFGAYCSGARRARIAVCGSFKDLPSFENGIWVSPVMVERERESKSFVYVKSYFNYMVVLMGNKPSPCKRIRRFSSVPSSLGE